MECTKCSRDENLVYMTKENFDIVTSKRSLECEQCGKEETIGYGNF